MHGTDQDVDLLYARAPQENMAASPAGTGAVAEYLKGSPEVAEIMRLIDGDKMRDSGKVTSALRLIASLLELREHPSLQKAAKGLGTRVLRKLQKQLHSATSSGKPRLAACALTVMSRVAMLGPLQAKDAWKRFSR